MDRLSRTWVAFLAIGLALVAVPMALAESGGATKPPGSSTGNCAPGKDCVARSFTADAGVRAATGAVSGLLEAGAIAVDGGTIQAPFLLSTSASPNGVVMRVRPTTTGTFNRGFDMFDQGPDPVNVQSASSVFMGLINATGWYTSDFTGALLATGRTISGTTKSLYLAADDGDGSSLWRLADMSLVLQANTNRVGVGNGTAPTMTLDVGGDGIRHRGVATGSLATCDASRAGGLAYDTTLSAHKLCNGSAWRRADAAGSALRFGGFHSYTSPTTHRAFAAEVATEAGTTRRLTFTVQTTGANGAGSTMGFEVWDATSSAHLGSIQVSCIASAGTVITSVPGDAAAYAAGDVIHLRQTTAAENGGSDCGTMPTGHLQFTGY